MIQSVQFSRSEWRQKTEYKSRDMPASILAIPIAYTEWIALKIYFVRNISKTHLTTDLRIPKICQNALPLHPSGGKAGKTFNHLKYND